MSSQYRHPTRSTATIGNLRLTEIGREVRVDIYRTGEDDGYHPHGNDWWVNGTNPYSFQYLTIDSLYPAQYFGQAGHPDKKRADALYAYMQEVYRDLFGRDFASVLELGVGGGEITQAFHGHGIDYLAVEGTTAGVERLIATGLDPRRIQQHDLKFMPPLSRRYELVMCTEVAEHLEPFFASKIVDNCIRHSDVVWFSAANRERRAHYHHINEQAIEVWDNLFGHMGFPFFVELNGMEERASRLYLSADLGRRLASGATQA